MATAANILRELIAASFGVDPQDVILSGEISPKFVPQDNRGHSWCSSQEEQKDTVYGFSSREGFHHLPIRAEYTYSNNGEVDHKEGQSISDFLKNNKEYQKDYIFFLINSIGKEYGETGQTFNKWTLYKSVDFKSHWEKQNTADLARWADWLQEDKIKNIVNKF